MAKFLYVLHLLVLYSCVHVRMLAGALPKVERPLVAHAANTRTEEVHDREAKLKPPPLVSWDERKRENGSSVFVFNEGHLALWPLLFYLDPSRVFFWAQERFNITSQSTTVWGQEWSLWKKDWNQ